MSVMHTVPVALNPDRNAYYPVTGQYGCHYALKMFEYGLGEGLAIQLEDKCGDR
jgi:hypothetical protein